VDLVSRFVDSAFLTGPQTNWDFLPLFYGDLCSFFSPPHLTLAATLVSGEEQPPLLPPESTVLVSLSFSSAIHPNAKFACVRWTIVFFVVFLLSSRRLFPLPLFSPAPLTLTLERTFRLHHRSLSFGSSFSPVAYPYVSLVASTQMPQSPLGSAA